MKDFVATGLTENVLKIRSNKNMLIFNKVIFQVIIKIPSRNFRILIKLSTDIFVFVI